LTFLVEQALLHFYSAILKRGWGKKKGVGGKKRAHGEIVARHAAAGVIGLVLGPWILFCRKYELYQQILQQI
jgi:hypothetical protein